MKKDKAEGLQEGKGHNTTKGNKITWEVLSSL